MDTFQSKLEILFKDAAIRFKDFEYNDSVLDAEVENYLKFAKRLEPYIAADTVQYISNAYTVGKCILVEGGETTMPDVDFWTYPFVTSSNPSVGGICTGLGISPECLGDIIGVVCLLCFLLGSLQGRVLAVVWICGTNRCSKSLMILSKFSGRFPGHLCAEFA